MFELSIENQRGEIITLTHNESKYQVISVSGLNPPNASLYSSAVVGMDGELFNSSRLENRNIVITVHINGNAEENRNNLYKRIKSKQYAKVYYKTASKDVFCEGYVETIENDPFTNGQTVQISIVCYDPYLQAIDEIYTDISKLVGLFTFPFSFGAGGIIEGTITDAAREFGEYDQNRMIDIYNNGAEIGLLMMFSIAGGNVSNPIIYNVVTREFFGLSATFITGDRIEINTNKGKKSVILIRDGETINIINSVIPNSSWLTLREGDNTFAYNSDTGIQYLSSYFVHREKYQGV